MRSSALKGVAIHLETKNSICAGITKVAKAFILMDVKRIFN
jgi:hypothetical protein